MMRPTPTDPLRKMEIMCNSNVLFRILSSVLAAGAATVLLAALPGCNVSNCCHCTCDGDSCSADIDVSSSDLMDCTSECEQQCATAGCPFDSGEPC